jgi:hypothetical protein
VSGKQVEEEEEEEEEDQEEEGEEEGICKVLTIPAITYPILWVPTLLSTTMAEKTPSSNPAQITALVGAIVHSQHAYQ